MYTHLIPESVFENQKKPTEREQLEDYYNRCYPVNFNIVPDYYDNQTFDEWDVMDVLDDHGRYMSYEDFKDRKNVPPCLKEFGKTYKDPDGKEYTHYPLNPAYLTAPYRLYIVRRRKDLEFAVMFTDEFWRKVTNYQIHEHYYGSGKYRMESTCSTVDIP
jgi:hypothetical protein